MADRHWVGATNGTWNSTANWSATQGGAGGASVPTTGDNVFINKAISANSYINVNQDIGAINSLSFTDYSTGNVAWYLGGGTSTTTLGTAWTVPTGITIDVATGTYVLGVLNVTFSGSAPNVIKTGGGGLLRSSPTTGSWGTATFDVQAGWIGASGVTNALGTGAITLANGTGISAATAAVSLGNPLTVNGDIFVNRYLDSTTTALGILTATGAISLGSSQRTLTVGGTGAANVNAASFTGVISGTGGFIVDGDPSSFVGNQATLYGLRLTNTGNTVSGPVVTKNVLEIGTYAQPPGTNGNAIPSVSNVEINGNSAWLRIVSNTSMTTPTFSGTGNVVLYGSLGVTFTCPPGAFTNLNTSSATYGLWVLGGYGFNIDVTDLPSKVYWDGWTSTQTPAIRYFGTSGSPVYWNTSFILTERVSSPTPTEIQANGSSGSSVIITGTISRGTGTQNLRLAGTNTDDNTVSGVISTALSIEKSNVGKWVLSGANTYTGATTLTAGTLKITNGSALGAASSTTSTMASTSTLQLQGNIVVNKASTAFTTTGATIQNVSGVNTLTLSSLTMNASFSIIASADLLEITNPITTGGTAQTLTITGPGAVWLSNTGSSYVSSTVIQSGTVYVNKLANAGANSSLGAPASGQATITMGAGGSVVFTNTGSTVDTTDRSIVFAGGNLTDLQLSSAQTGSGSSTYSSGGTLTFTGAGSHTLALDASNTATNTLARTIADGPSGATSIFKVGAGTWSITGAISATGQVASAAGLLDLGTTNRTFSGGLVLQGGNVSIATGNTISANVSFSSGGGTLTGTLVGANTLTVGSGSTEVTPAVLNQPDSTGSNTFTGAVTINGCVDLITPISTNVATAGNGRVLGTANTTTVSSTGIIRTRTTTSSDQRGRARYNNLTLQAGSKLKIGFAA